MFIAEVLAIPDWFDVAMPLKKQRVAEAIRAKDFAAWQVILAHEPELCITPVLTFLEAVHQPHAQARGVLAQTQLVSPLRFTKK